MAETADMVYRRRRRRARMMDERRFTIPGLTLVRAAAAARILLQMSPCFLLSMAEIMEMPSGLYAACIVSLAAMGRPVRWPCVGAGAAVLLRFLWGYDPRWESLITIGLLRILAPVLAGRRNPALMAATALSLLPMAVRGWMASTALPALTATGAIALATLSAPVLCRGLQVCIRLWEKKDTVKAARMEDGLAVGYLLLMIMCGGARLLVAGLNMAVLLAGGGVLILAICCGSSAGCAAGILSGLCMSLTGLPMMHAVALGCGGFLAGVMRAAGRRWLTCACYGTAGVLVMLCSGTAGRGCAAALLAASAAVFMLPSPCVERITCVLRQFMGTEPCSGDAYAACILAEWERTVDALAMSVPVPAPAEQQRDGAWWTARLCDGCGAGESCEGIRSAAVVEAVERVWSFRDEEEDIWPGALEGLRGLGCQRLYHLQANMNALRKEEARSVRSVRQAMSQRNMLVTHLHAMAGAARRFAHLSLGESWWDALNARRIRTALSDAAAPVGLMWLRRVEGHLQAVFTLEELIGARKQAQELCELVSEATGMPMMTVSVDGGRVRLAERPPLEAVCGFACACADGEKVCGDTAMHCVLADGRFMAALSDGMGHGEKAALCSRQTSELLRLCLDAGYSLQQTLTAVNGMMLLGDTGERFITLDLVTMDLWNGKMVLEKLGAAGSWVLQQGELTRLDADALPLGILEDVDAGERCLRLAPGDALLLLTDGVEEAFGDPKALRDAVKLALTEYDPSCAAESLLQAAERASDGGRQDDQTVLVIRIRAVQDAHKRV